MAEILNYVSICNECIMAGKNLMIAFQKNSKNIAYAIKSVVHLIDKPFIQQFNFEY